MKKISAFFLSIFLMALLSCAPEEDTKTIIITPPELMSAVTCSVQSGMITANDKIGLNAPQNATDATLYYEIAVGADCETPTEGSSKKYTGEITLSNTGLNPSDDDIITLKVLAVKKGFENGVWTFRWRFSDGSMPLVNDDAFLKSVSASNNEANFGFLPNVFVYDEISVPNDVEKISINYEKSNKDATVETYPASLKDIPLTDGRTTLITFTVTSSDKSTKKRYSFNIYRASKEEPPFKSTDCFLLNLLVKGDTLIDFDKNKENYKASVANSVATTSVTYLLSSNKAQVTTTPASLENISLTAGQTTDVSIKVTAEDPNYTKTYKVSIYREPAGSFSADATLKALSVTGGSLSFSPATKDYEVTIPSSYAGAVSVAYEENHIGATVTTIPNDLNNISIAPGATETVTILVTAENKVATETYTVKIKRDSVNLDGNANLSNIALSAGSLSFDKDTLSYDVTVENAISSIAVTATAESAKATVVVDPSGSVSLTAGVKTSITINVTAEDGTPKTYVVNVTRQNDDNPPPPVAGDYYWTNKNGKVGTNKTISSWSDWTVAEQITQNAAYDDPRTWKGHQEVPYDVYAMYAAWDNDNLYVMVELVNGVDRAKDLFMWHNYASSDNAWWDNRDIPLGMLFNTGKGAKSNKPTVDQGGPIWENVDFSDAQGFDAMFYHSSKYGYAEHKSAFVGVGTPGFFTTTSAGVFSYGAANCTNFAGATADGSGVHVRYKRQCAVSTKIYMESTPSDNRGTSGQTGADLLNSTTYKDFKTTDLDMSYWYTIPLKSLGIDKAHIESKGIGIRQLTTNGGSLMDCSPWDVSMVDVAAEPCSDDKDTSQEKEDVDNITSAQARVGKM